MRSPAAYLFAILVGAIIWFFFQYFKIEGTDTLRVVPKDETEINQPSGDEEKSTGLVSKLQTFFTKEESAGDGQTSQPKVAQPSPVKGLPPRTPNSIRIASFRLRDYGAATPNRAFVQQVLLRVIRQFDLVALQGLSRTGGAAAITELASQAGNYGVIVGRSSVVQHQDEQFAYVFNTNTIVADRTIGLYTLGDPDDLLRREPLVGWFRAKEAQESEAFTFSLVNVNTDQHRVRQELNVLDNVITEVRADGRNEDDVITLGSFQARDDQFFQLGEVRGLVAAIRATATNVRGTSQTENILWQDPDTDEFKHAAGVFDYREPFELNDEQAQTVSYVLPVWADFSIFEGGDRRVARHESAAR